MKKLTTALVIAISGAIGLIGCSEDDKVDPITIEVENFTATIAENPSNGDVIGTIAATVSGGTAAYSLSAMNPTGALAINATSGELTVANSALFDFEARQSITATVNATVGTQSTTASVTITITNVLDPSLSLYPFAAEIDENPANGQVIGTISYNLSEGSPGYSISVEPSGSIGINSEGGVVVLDSAAFNYEIRSSIYGSYTVSVNELSVSAEINITILNVFDPEISVDDLTISVNENPASGATLGNLFATTEEGLLEYTLSEVTPTGALEMSLLGTIYVADASLFDYESRTSISATAVVYAYKDDSFTSYVSKEVSISITINDVTTPSSGLIAEYLFSGNSNDTGGNGYDPTINNATLAADRFNTSNSAYQFNGSQYMSIPNYTALSLNTISVSLWFKSNSTVQNQRFVFVGSTADGRQNYSLNYNILGSRKSDFRYEPTNPLPGGTYAESTTVVTDGEWHHVVGVRDHSAKTLKIYIDGNLERTVNYTNDPVTSNSAFQIGRAFNSQYFIGSLDEIRIYNRALSAVDVLALRYE